MTLEEVEKAGNWSNDEYFDYMKGSGEWDAFEKQEHAASPCDRCEQDVEVTWRVEAYFDVQDECTERYTLATEFAICTLCMLELFGSTQTDRAGRKSGYTTFRL